jgi:hypothetical protein
MNTAIGSSGPVKVNIVVTEQILTGIKDLTLNGFAFFLHLPPGIAGTVIFDRKFVS